MTAPNERQVAFLAFLLTAAIVSASALLAWSKVILWSLLVTL